MLNNCDMKLLCYHSVNIFVYCGSIHEMQDSSTRIHVVDADPLIRQVWGEYGYANQKAVSQTSGIPSK